MTTETTNPVAKLDTYELRHLVSHLELANRADDLHWLLSLKTDEQKNAWYEAKATVGDLQGYLVDVNQAWRIAERDYSPGKKLETGANIGRQFHYALIITSLSSLALNVPPGLLSAAVQEGLSTPAEAFASIRQLPDNALLAASLAELAPHLADAALLQQATTTARNITTEPDRYRALSALALQWARQQQITEVQAIIEEISEETILSQLIAKLAPLLPADMLPDLLQQVTKMSNSESKAGALSALVPHLSSGDSELFLKAIQKIRSQRLRALTFISTLATLPEPHRSQVLAKSLNSTQSLTNLIVRAEITAALLPYLQKNQRDETLRVLIQDIHKLKDDDKRGAAWAEIAAFLPISEQNQAFADVLNIKNKRIRAEALEKYAPTLTKVRDKKAAVDTAKQIDDREFRVSTIVAILPHLSGQLRNNARLSGWKAAKEIKNAEKRGHAFRLLAPYLTNNMWLETMQILRRKRSAEARAYILQGIATQLPDTMLEMALDVVAQIPSGPSRAASLTALTPRLSVENLLPKALATAREVGDAAAQLTLLVAVAPHLAIAGDQDEALEIVLKIRDADSRALALAGLVPRLSRLERRMAIKGVVEAVLRIDDTSKRSKIIGQIAPTLPQEMLRMAHTIVPESDRAYALLELIPHLSGHLRQSTLQEALEAVETILTQGVYGQNKASQDELLDPAWESFETTAFEPDLSSFIERDRLEFTYWAKRRHVEWYAEGLLKLIPRLAAAGLVTEAKKAAAAILADVPYYAWSAYASLVPYLEEPEHTLTAQDYLIDKNSLDAQRIITLAEIAPNTLVPLRAVALKAIRYEERTVFKIPREPGGQIQWTDKDGQDLLVVVAKARAALAHCQPEPHRRRILIQGIELAQNSENALIQGPLLAALLPYVAEFGYPEEALEAAMSIPTPADRALALVGLGPHMPPGLWPELLQTGLATDEDESKVVLLAGLAPNLPHELLAQALEAARKIESLAGRLQALAPLALRMNQFPFDNSLYPLWRDILHLLSRGTRRDLLRLVPLLEPVMVTLCGSDQIVTDIAHSVTSVGQSWP